MNHVLENEILFWPYVRQKLGIPAWISSSGNCQWLFPLPYQEPPLELIESAGLASRCPVMSWNSGHSASSWAKIVKYPKYSMVLM